MEELNTCIAEWLNTSVSSCFNKDIEKDLQRFWLSGIVNLSNDEAIENCSMYVSNFGWDDVNVNDYKYFHSDSIEDVVGRRLAKVADNYLIALG